MLWKYHRRTSNNTNINPHFYPLYHPQRSSDAKKLPFEMEPAGNGKGGVHIWTLRFSFYNQTPHSTLCTYTYWNAQWDSEMVTLRKLSVILEGVERAPLSSQPYNTFHPRRNIRNFTYVCDIKCLFTFNPRNPSLMSR